MLSSSILQKPAAHVATQRCNCLFVFILSNSSKFRASITAEGVTSLDPKGDGRHFISNGKDQTVKLWDLRRAHSQADLARGVTSMRGLPRFQWCVKAENGQTLRL